MLTEHQGHVLTTFLIAVAMLIGLLIMGHFLGKSIRKAEALKPIRRNRKERRRKKVTAKIGFTKRSCYSLRRSLPDRSYLRSKDSG